MKENQLLPTDSFKGTQDTQSQPRSAHKTSVYIVSIAVLGVLLIIASSISGCLMYQNNQLRKPVSQEFATRLTNTTSSTSATKPEDTITPTEKVLFPTQLPTPRSSITKQVLTDWQTYENQRFGIRFSNPGDYILDTTAENIYSDEAVIRLYDSLDYQPHSEGDQVGFPVMKISAYKNSEKLDVFEWFEKFTDRSHIVGEYKIRPIAGKNVIEYSLMTSMWEGDIIIVANEYHVVEFSVTRTSQTRRDFNRLVESFSFTEP